MSPTLGMYLEQPYACWRPYVEPGLLPQLAAVGVEKSAWNALRATWAGRRAKRRASGACRSQLKLLGGPRLSLPVVPPTGFYERRAGGEGVGWIAQAR